ncbi:MAG: hypothetical protein WBL72_01010, partial [Thermoguttaceae bacterium]
FREADFRSPGESSLFRELWKLPDADARTLAGRLALACQAPLEASPLLDEILARDTGKVVPLSVPQESAVRSLLASKPKPTSPAKAVATAVAEPPAVQPEQSAVETRAVSDQGTVPVEAFEEVLTLPPGNRSAFAVIDRVLLGLPRTGVARVRAVDRLLLALVGPENSILHNFLRVMAPLLSLMLLVGIAWEVTGLWKSRSPVGESAGLPSTTWMSPQPSSMSRVRPTVPMPTQPPSWQPPFRQPPLVASPEVPPGPLTGSPVLQEVKTVWVPASDSRSNSIRDAREMVLQGLEERSWDLLARMMTPNTEMYYPRRSAPNEPRQPTSVPERFVLTGRLAAVRVSEGKSLVYILPSGVPQPVQGSESFNLFDNLVSARRYPLAAVEFDGETLALPMSDYCVSDSVRVAVKRWTNNRIEWPQPGGQQPRVVGNFRDMRVVPPGIVEELRLAPFNQGQGGMPSMSMVCWSFCGEGIEKSGQPETWIDPRLGRGGTTSEEVIRRSPGFLMRTARSAKGVSGRLIAFFNTVSRVRSDDLVAFLTVPGTTEGTIRCEAHFGSTVQLKEFLDYPPGAVVEVAATIDDPVAVQAASPTNFLPPRGPLGPMPGNSAATPPALPTVWCILRLNCSQVYVQGKLATLVDINGPRRTNVVAPSGTPDAAVAALDEMLGKEATWSGRLERIRCQKGETHIVVNLASTQSRSVLGVWSFEAYADNAAFVDELADYVSVADSFSDADQVSVTGVVCGAYAARTRLQPAVPLLRIKSVECIKRPDARAVVGEKRKPGSFHDSTLCTGLAAVLRNPPAPGTEVKFTCRYSRFNEYSKTVRVTAESKFKAFSSVYAEIAFIGAAKTAFAQYRDGNRVEVTGVLSEEPRNFSSSLKFTGKTIVRESDPQSLITAVDFAADKEQWSKIRSNLQKNARQTLRAVGVFHRYSHENSNLKISVWRLYFDYDNIELLCANDDKSRSFLDTLKHDDELLFEFKVIDGPSFRRVGALKWMALLSTPDEHVAFRPPLIRDAGTSKSPTDAPRLILPNKKETASAEDGYFAIAIIANTTRLVIWSDVVHGTKGEAQEKLSKEIRSRNNRSINLRHSRSDRFSPRGPTRMETQAEAYQQIQNWREACLQKASHK